MTASFSDWAFERARTLEERFGAELLVEAVLPSVLRDEDLSWSANYEAQRFREKARKLNPAYEPVFTREAAERVEAQLAERKSLEFRQDEDRPIRDVSFLRFCPALDELTLLERKVRDLSPLRLVPGLRELNLITEASDFSPVGSLRQLEKVSLTMGCPWPELGSLDGLPALEKLTVRGNLTVLRAVGRFPALRDCTVWDGDQFSLPVRDLFDLPEMPELRRMDLRATWRLNGIERFPQLVNLAIHGSFDDLLPLGALKRLTHLDLHGGRYESLAPLATLPELRYLKVWREEPQDYSPLAEAPNLREVAVANCPTSSMEVAILNEALGSWGGDFSAHPPRPLCPVRMLLRSSPAAKESPPDGLPQRDFGDDKALEHSEQRWFSALVQRELDTLLGEEWRRGEKLYLSGGSGQIYITRPVDVERLGEVVCRLRELIAGCRFAWKFVLMVDTEEFYFPELTVYSDRANEGEEFNAARERDEWEAQKQREQERREFFERLHQFKLRKAGGMKVRPEEFAPAIPATETEPESSTQPHSSAEENTFISLCIFVEENRLLVAEKSADLAEYLLAMTCEPAPESTEEDDE